MTIEGPWALLQLSAGSTGLKAEPLRVGVGDGETLQPWAPVTMDVSSASFWLEPSGSLHQ